jgi:hypothetical protein
VWRLAFVRQPFDLDHRQAIASLPVKFVAQISAGRSLARIL